MTLTTGCRLGPYEMLAPIGAWGMAAAFILAALPGVVGGAEPPSLRAVAVRFEDEALREAVLSALRRFFDTMAARDVAGATAVVLPEGRFYSTRVIDGKSVTRTFTNREYLDELAARKEEVLERIWDPEVRIRGRIASVWAPYDFWTDGAFSHCGVDVFNLVEAPEGWKISGGVYTVETEGCAPSPLGPPRFAAPARETAPPPAR